MMRGIRDGWWGFVDSTKKTLYSIIQIRNTAHKATSKINRRAKEMEKLDARRKSRYEQEVIQDDAGLSYHIQDHKTTEPQYVPAFREFPLASRGVLRRGETVNLRERTKFQKRDLMTPRFGLPTRNSEYSMKRQQTWSYQTEQTELNSG